MVELFEKSEDPEQPPHSVASDLSLHCLPITRLGVSRLQWVKDCVSGDTMLLPISIPIAVLDRYFLLNIFEEW